VGGLSAEMISSRRFTGRFPPQYKNFTCNHCEVLLPPRVDEMSPSYPTLTVPPGKLPYIRRELVTPLDGRLPPAIMIKTNLRPDDRHFFGVNRPYQTGEEIDVGFRTSTWYSLPSIDYTINTKSFRPSQSIATPNMPVLSPMRIMKVDGTYPFRKEQSRKNGVKDLYHLLLSDGDCSRNKLQMFTCIGSQQCGYFMQNGNSSLPIGRVVTRVIRSWTFLQSESEEDAIYEEETVSLGLGGVTLNDRPRHAESMPRGVLMKNSRNDARVAILKRMPEEVVAKKAPKMAAEESSSTGKDLIEQKPSPARTKVPNAADIDPFIEKEIRTHEKSGISDSFEEETDDSISENLDSDAIESKQNLQHSAASAQVAEQNSVLVAESISQVIGETFKSFSSLGPSHSKPEDLIRLGMGIGASLGAQGLFSANQEKFDKSSTNEEHITRNIPTIEPELEASEDGRDDTNNNVTRSYSLDENKFVIAADESNVLNYSDLNPSPQGLLNTIAATRVGTKHVEYLSYTYSLNLPSSQNVQPQKPRSMAEEWKEDDYDPWSAGREPTSSTIIRSLAHETKRWPKPVNRVDGSDFGNTARDFAALCTVCRHGKYRELEEMINNPSWTLPIDYCDDSGNTLLMIACQNGNKRISKLCLRRGSQINHQNLNGNTCLHFAFGYGFEELGEYLISKGADDSLQNAVGNTCYEGLDMDDL